MDSQFLSRPSLHKHWFVSILLLCKASAFRSPVMSAVVLIQVDALVDHFARFSTDERQLPTVWHQSLRVFVQRYKHEIRAEDKAALKRVTRAQQHHQVIARQVFVARKSTNLQESHGCFLWLLSQNATPGFYINVATVKLAGVLLQITPEIHRELDASRDRGEKPSDVDVAVAAAAVRKPGAGGENPRDLPPVVLMDED